MIGRLVGSLLILIAILHGVTFLNTLVELAELYWPPSLGVRHVFGLLLLAICWGGIYFALGERDGVFAR